MPVNKNLATTPFTDAGGGTKPPEVQLENQPQQQDTATEQPKSSVASSSPVTLGNTKATTQPSIVQDTSAGSYATQDDRTEKGRTSNPINRPSNQANVFDNVTNPASTPIETTMDRDAREKAQMQYGSDVLTAKQNAQQNAVTLKQNTSQYQEQADMMQYQNNQSAEKVGWTGGYVLDQNRQMDYLKASLAAQMYGAIELQKYGYDTSLAAARLSYDLNQKEYARQYYQDAVNKALNEAQITGVYISAEIQDMLNQRTIAQKALEDEGYEYNAETGKWLRDGQEPDSQDYQLIKTINDWFTSNGITEAGQKTLAAIQAENTDALNWHTQLWTEYNAALQAAKADIDDNPTVFLMYGEDNNLVYTGATSQDNLGESLGGEVKTIDLSGLTPDELEEYADTCPKAKEQVTAYFTWKANEIINSNKTTDKDGNVTNIDEDKIAEQLNQLEEESRKATGQGLQNVDGWQQSQSTQTPGTYAGTETVHNGDYYKKQTAYSLQELFNNYNSTAGTSFKIETAAIRTGTGEQFWSVDWWKDDDMEINVYNGSDRKKNYDCDVDWSVGFDRKNNSYTELNNNLNSLYPKASQNDLIIYNNDMYIYNLFQNNDGTTYGVWGKIQYEAGGKKLKDDITGSYVNGTIPQRWN